MEKLSNVTKNKIISLDRINFNGFSLSQKWVGYFEAKDLSNYELIFDSSKKIKSFFKNEVNNFFILSSLTFDDDRELDEHPRYIREYLDSIYKEAKSSGFLIPYSGLMEKYYEFDYVGDDSILPANLLTLTFDNGKLFPYCELAMAYNKVFGEICFLINPKLSIALYPHNEKGYGCISLNDNTDLLISFLKFCQGDERYNVIINC